jgi:hypothetical protein
MQGSEGRPVEWLGMACIRKSQALTSLSGGVLRCE